MHPVDPDDPDPAHASSDVDEEPKSLIAEFHTSTAENRLQSLSPTATSFPLHSAVQGNTTEVHLQHDRHSKDQPATEEAPLSDLPPLDFERFLQHMRHPSSHMLTRYLKSFLNEFGKKVWTPDQQQRIVQDFIHFSLDKMRSCDPWLHATQGEMDVAREGLEKLVMTKIYRWTFQPVKSPDAKQDRELSLKMRYFRWIEPRHLDIPERLHTGLREGVKAAQDELRLMNRYKSPRDKLICVLNCCKLIMGFLHTQNHQANADDFLPVLIFTVITANPEKVMSNLQFVSRFRRTDKLQSEAGYYLTNMMGAVSFIERMDQSSLTITTDEYEEWMCKTIPMVEEEDEQARQHAAETTERPEKATLQDDNPTSSSAASTPTLRILQKPMAILTKLFHEATGSDMISPMTPGAPSALSDTQALAKTTTTPQMNVTATHRRAQSTGSGFMQTFFTPTTPQVAATATTISTRRRSSHDVTTVEELVPSFERKLTTAERSMLDDYEMQLAMVMSLSMEHSRMGSEQQSVTEQSEVLLMDEPISEEMPGTPPLIPDDVDTSKR